MGVVLVAVGSDVPENLFSPSWYRVSRLRPRIRSHVEFYRHRYRGQSWYVLQDRSQRGCHRLSASAYQLAGLMNGRRTTQEIWEALHARLGDAAPTQDETIRLLGLLHSADALHSDIAPDTAEMLRRSQRRRSSEFWGRIANPLSVRVPLLDPDDFLERWLPVVRPLFSWPAAALWCALVLSAAVLAIAHWPEISAGSVATLLDPRNLLVLWLVYPLLKGLHELGHAFATKIWGGEVHEMGILFLVFIPLPYVDASDSAAFPDKWKRAGVGAAGIAVELAVAAAALWLWLAAEPGIVRSLAYNLMWIGGASTLLFNGNPLLRFDGYYVLADLIEIPNLSARSTQYLGSLVQRRLFGLEKVRNPASAPGEPAWFVVYGIAAFFYRLFVIFTIALFVAGRYLVVGVLLAILAVTMQVALPALRHASFLLTSPRLGDQRSRALGASAAIAFGAAGFLLLVPLPLFTSAEGVVWPPEGAQVRAGANGFVIEFLSAPDATVRAGDALVLTRDPSLEAEIAVLEARVAELRARRHAERTVERVQAQMTGDELASVEAELARAREREVIVRSSADGRFVAVLGPDLVGRYLEAGALVGYVIADSISSARVVIPQSDIALVRGRTLGVEVRLAGRVAEVFPARIRRQVPAASNRLPSAALGTRGGGRLPVAPGDDEGTQTLETVFQLELALPAHAGVREVGGRAYVRFYHGSEPLAMRGLRALRRLFLRQLGV